MLCFLTCVLASDSVPIRVDRQAPSNYWLMLHFYQIKQFRDRPGYLAHIFENIITDMEHRTDPCKWSGTTCDAEDNIRAVRLAKQEESDQIISLDYLPPTCQEIHLMHLKHATGFLAERLPRELRYLYIHSCFLLDTKTKTDAKVDFRKLPPHLEEFIVYGGWFHSKMYIASLPAYMRIIAVYNRRLGDIFVDSWALPASLRKAAFMRTGNTVKIHYTDEQFSDDRFFPFFMLDEILNMSDCFQSQSI